MNQTKTCRLCLAVKPIHDFPVNPTGRFGVRTECKACYSEIKKARYQKNPEGNPRRTEGAKKCSKCGTEKPVEDFLSEKKALDGLKAECGDCLRVRSRNFSRNNRDAIRERNAAAMTEEKRQKRNEDARSKYHSMTDEQRIRRKARAKLFYFLSEGRIKKLPCEVCGNQEVEAHHDDYSKPLEVKWLCIKHHGVVHRKYERENVRQNLIGIPIRFR